MQKKYYPYLDLLKFICCIGIVGIHTWPFYYAAEPLRDWFERLCRKYSIWGYFLVFVLLLLDFKYSDYVQQ